MSNKRRIIGNILLVTGLLLLLGAGGLYFYNMIESNRQAEDSLEIVSRVKTEISAAVTDPSNDQKSSVAEPSELVPADVGGSLYDGYLAIPKIDLEMAVFHTWNDSYLRKSACRYYGSPYTNDYIIAGHNYRSGFRKLRDLVPGDEVYFTDMGGHVTKYEVKLTEVIDGTDVDGMISGGWDLSLYTCTYGGEARFTVRCGKV